MAVDAEDLILQPFRELVAHGQEASKNAQDLKDEEETERSSQMIKSANGVIKEGERALQRLEPLWTSQLEKHGQAFLEAINENESLSESRVILDDLLYDFDDYVELDKFDAEKYAEIRLAAKSFARTSIETIKRLRIDKSAIAATRSATPVDQYPPSHNFPPLPPLPRLHQQVANTQAPSSHEAPILREEADYPMRSRQDSVRKSSGIRAEPPVKGNMRISAISDASSFEIRSARRLNFHHIAPVDGETKQHPTRRPSSPDVLGQDDVHVLRGQPSSYAPQQLNGSTPWTTAWVHEQASSARSKPHQEPIPEQLAMPSNASGRYTTQSSERASSIFDMPTSPITTRTSIFSSTNETSYKSSPPLARAPGNNSHNHHDSLPSPTLDDDPPVPKRVVAPRTLTLRPFPVTEDQPDNGLILADELLGPHRVAKQVEVSSNLPWIFRRENCEIGPQGSLFAMGGLCKGAHLFASGGWETGTQSSYEYTSKTYEAQCVECQYRQDMSRLVADMKKDVKAYYTTKGVHYRLRFLYKSHIFTNTGSIKHYACLFCSHEGYTTRPDDATVFGSLDSLFSHLARHTQPLPNIAGIRVLYGEKESLNDGDLEDCDLHFPNLTNPSGLSEEVSARLSCLPTAWAIKSHNIREEEVDLVLSDGKKERPLPFFTGGRIIGVEFLEKWDGKYCVGWHDGVRGFFPSKIVELEAPPRGEVRLPGTNGDGITVKTRWKWAPKDGTIGWLNFKAGDTIHNVSWTFQEQWCWSGMTKNGKVGFFPQSHIKPESIRAVISNNDSSTASIKSGNSGKTKSSSRTFALHTRGFARKV